MATKKTTTIKKKPVAKKKVAVKKKKPKTPAKKRVVKPKYKTSIANKWMTRKKIKFETVEQLDKLIARYFETSKTTKYMKVRKQTKNGWEEKMQPYEVYTYLKGGLRIFLNVSNDNMRDWAKGKCELKREFSQTIAHAETYIKENIQNRMINSDSNAEIRALEFYLKSAFKVRDRETTKERLEAEQKYKEANQVGFDDDETDNFSKAMEEAVKAFDIEDVNSLIDPASIGKDGGS